MIETVHSLLAVAMVLAIVSVLVPVAERLRLPHTVLVAVTGLALGFGGAWVIHLDHHAGVLGDVFLALDALRFGADSLLPLFLPPLLMTAGLTVDVRRLMDEISAVLLLAIVAVLVCIAARVLPDMGWQHVAVLLAVAVGAFGARALVVFGMLPALAWMRLVQPVDGRYKVILVWGGLRGAVTIVLAMVAAGNPRLSKETQDFVALSATGFVLFTLFFNATTLGLVMHWLGLDRLSPLDLAMRDRVIALSKVAVAQHLRRMSRQPHLPSGVGSVETSLGTSAAQCTSGVPAELALALHERVKIGLITLVIREKKLVLDLFDHQILSRRMVAILVADSERLIDLVRDRGVDGHDQWLHDTARLHRYFRFALALQRSFGVEGPLAQALADRVEGILITKGVLEELAAKDVPSIADLGARLRAHVALPGERIVKMGDPADDMYFVAAGGVTVHAKRRSEQLGEGDFFGEMGLLSSQPRNADVITSGYCHLLALSKKDFDRVLQRRPEIRAKIEAVAAQRGASNFAQKPPATA